MAQDRIQQLLQQGIEAAKAGQKPQAFQILQQLVRIDPRNETAWLWLSSVARNDQERAFCLRQLYDINPQNELALKGLRAMGIDPTVQQQAAVSQPDVPIVSQDKLAAIQPAVDEFLRSYNPEPYTPLEIVWVHKDKRRYGEGAARRLRTSVYAVAAVGVVALLAVALVAGIFLFDALQSDDTQEAGRRDTQTPTRTLGPTLTPTQIINTPLPNTLTPWPTPVDDLPRGNLARQPTATGVYPPIAGNSLTIRNRPTVVAVYAAGRYEQLSTLSSVIRATDVGLCWQENYYYEAMGLARQGGRSNLNLAEELLQEALASDAQGNDNTCIANEAALINAGRCFVNYQQALSTGVQINTSELNQARSLCEQAHAADPQLVQAAETLAEIYIIDGNFNGAFTVLDTTRNARPLNRGNVNLLLGLADVELARGNTVEALDYIEQALYVDPLSEEALRKRTKAHLVWAAEASGNTQRFRYAVASIYAEEHYLFYYPGAPMGYVLLAEAKVGEGNPHKALVPLGTVINALENRTEPDEAVLQRAYEIRVGIYLDDRNWEAAYDDLLRLIDLEPNNLAWLDLLKQVATELERYDVVRTNLERLLASRPNDVTLQLEEARLLSRICQYEGRISCNYRQVSREISDEFIESMEAASVQRADARSYQIEANFALTLDDDNLTDSQRNAQLTGLVNQLLEVLSIRETAADYYLLGRLYAALDEPEQAIAAFDVALYWDQLYDYPFGDALEEARQETVDLTAS